MHLTYQELAYRRHLCSIRVVTRTEKFPMTEYADQPGCTGGKFVVVESSRSVSCPLNPFRKRRNILKKMTAVGVLVCIALFASLFFLMSNQAARGASDTVAAITQLENESVKA